MADGYAFSVIKPKTNRVTIALGDIHRFLVLMRVQGMYRYPTNGVVTVETNVQQEVFELQREHH